MYLFYKDFFIKARYKRNKPHVIAASKSSLCCYSATLALSIFFTSSSSLFYPFLAHFTELCTSGDNDAGSNSIMNIQQFKEEIAAQRNLLVTHPLYSSIESINDIRVFMEHHVFAVWDFMSLLKSLQLHLTSTTIPWVPVGDAKTRYLINEIVLGEESDVHPAGGYTSHFELYLEAMRQLNCNTATIEKFIQQVKDGTSVPDALQAVPPTAAQFVRDTFHIINGGKKHVLAAVFTFGREDLIPDMFLGMVKELSTLSKDKMDMLIYYLERHIEVDGEHHSLLAYEMTETLCGNDEEKWQEALEAVRFAIQSRVQLWNSIHHRIRRIA